MAIPPDDIKTYFVVRDESVNQLEVEVGGTLNLRAVDQIWPEARKLLNAKKPKVLVVDAENIIHCDGAGIAFLLWLRKCQLENNREILFLKLASKYSRRLEVFAPKKISPKPLAQSFKEMLCDIGDSVYGWWRSLYNQIFFFGELTKESFELFRHPKRFRFNDYMQVIEACGPNAFSLAVLIGTLFGLILAFQAAIPMKMFGVEIYVADLVGLSLFRVLGSFIAATLFCARSGSAFAAEIGTMKINEELDALTTLGVNPVSFLVLPRIVASILMVPFLSLTVTLSGLFGAGIVMYSLGFTPIAYYNELVSAISLTDFLSGFAKSFVFGYIIAAVGCYCGLHTKNDSSAVGRSTTAAVVNGIVLIVIAEGVMSVLLYIFGI